MNIGILHAAPKIPKLKRAKVYKKPKGRAPTEEEFQKILKAIPAVVGEERAVSWGHFWRGFGGRDCDYPKLCNCPGIC